MNDASPQSAIRTNKLNLWYGTFQALFDVDLEIPQGRITSLIGPSGCGKSTFLRSVNRINERLGYVRISGSIDVLGENVCCCMFKKTVEDLFLISVKQRIGDHT